MALFKNLGKKAAVFVFAVACGTSWAYASSNWNAEAACCRYECADAFPGGGSSYNYCYNSCMRVGWCRI